MKNSKKYAYSIMALAVLATLVTVAPAFAQTTTSTQPNNGGWGGGMGMHNGKGMMKPAVFGTVSAVNGNTITVNGKQGFGANATSISFTVDATNAKIMKNNTAGTISSIAVGDTVVVQGTVSGTNVTATTIRDGIMMHRGAMNKTGQSTQPTFTGNGEPVVAGTVSVVNGSTLTITNKSNATYTVDATNAKITEGSNTVAVSNIAVGDMVVVQGTVNGNSIVASGIIDQPASTTTSTTSVSGTTTVQHKGFFGGIGSFFSHIFGF